ncbi:hypothetical protein DN398_25045 [Bacillus sp. JAS102]|uniref:Uncharacterized protein n=1 Tax=Bacillus thuringiensis serovar sooncheon TaxID=180891 RepID=A0A9Q5X4Y5_BACTU|nr:hypothetical protein [Bacillus thuringiensis]KAA0796668.1 hypothetical protein DN398_25045 [Bacillus sp. JAS102]OTW73466.1 hypothetical protein BK707_02565 [Bacillus thuringiensis serovar coreanensis]OTX54695.1 hypothetical protein BK724_03680 [Bacillus thuringiensis serovar sooncheon]OTX54765.1 hypothetical protein BK724_04095 [Bacillus thuringiensis serovar sooncheon]OTX55701.1 hypothetical protein BK725_10860 [Bacillus thuringiensis serovar guiyangiensis]
MIHAFKKVFSESYKSLIIILIPAFLFVDYNNIIFIDYIYFTAVIVAYVAFLFNVVMTCIRLRYEEQKKAHLERKRKSAFRMKKRTSTS